MNIVFVHPSDEMYGADRVLLNSVGALSKSNRVEVWLPVDVSYPERLLSARLDEMGVRVRHVDIPIVRRAYFTPRGLALLGRRVILSRRLRTQLRTFDVIYLNTAATLLVSLFTLRSDKVLLHLHEDMSDPSAKLLLPLFLRIRKIAAVSQAVRKALPKHLRRRTTVINNGFEVSGAASMEPKGPIKLLLASRWNAWKGHAEFLSALSAAKREDVRVTVLGGPPRSGSAVDVRQIVTDLNLNDRVDVVGEVASAAPFIADSDLVVVPSTRPDPLPTIAIEALGGGRPVLASDVGGLSEILGTNTGWLLPNPKHAPAAWEKFLATVSRDEIRAAGAGARMRFDENFSIASFHTAIREWVGGTSRG